jgi:hypothetical protein
MDCSSHRHQGQDCCRAEPAIHSVIGQPSSAQCISLSPVALGVVPTFCGFQGIEVHARMIVEHSHGPPLSGSQPALAFRV